MFISDAGGVGIGTNSPAAKLHVNGADEGIRIQGTATGASNYAYATFYDAAGTRIGYVGDGSSGDNDLFLSADIGNVNLETAGLRRLTVTQSGNVGIGTGAPAAKLHVVGTAGNATGVWSTVSDRRLKKDIEPIEKALETVERLQGVTFHWKDAEKDAQFGRVRGLIAQDVEKVLPEWIKTDPDGYKRLEPIGVDALLIEAIKELKTENENLKTKVSELDRLQTEMAKLTVLVEKLAAQEEKPAKVLTSTR
jgi:hypothetical protein